MGTCRDCRHWRPEHDGEYLDHSPGGNAWGVCAMTETNDRAFNYGCDWDHPETRAVASGVDGSSHWLWTMPGFGCVQFERKEG